MVHCNTQVTPAVPEKVLVGLVGAVIIPPIPLIILHEPVPTPGELPASVTTVNPQVVAPVWSGPAFAIVATGLISVATDEVAAAADQPFASE